MSFLSMKGWDVQYFMKDLYHHMQNYKSTLNLLFKKDLGKMYMIASSGGVVTSSFINPLS